MELGSDQLVRLDATANKVDWASCILRAVESKYHVHKVESITWLGSALQQYHQPETCQCCIFVMRMHIF